MSLCDALGNPDHVPALLLLETDIGIEDPKVELLHEGADIDLHLWERNEKVYREEEGGGRVREDEGGGGMREDEG